MEPKNKQNDQNENVREQQDRENKNVQKAHEQAEKDMDKDPDLGIHSPNDDLDEGETARLGEDKTDLV